MLYRKLGRNIETKTKTVNNKNVVINITCEASIFISRYLRIFVHSHENVWNISHDNGGSWRNCITKTGLVDICWKRVLNLIYIYFIFLMLFLKMLFCSLPLCAGGVIEIGSDWEIREMISTRVHYIHSCANILGNVMISSFLPQLWINQLDFYLEKSLLSPENC